VLVYYPLMLCGVNMAKVNKLTPYIGISAADVLLLFTAMLMYRRLARS